MSAWEPAPEALDAAERTLSEAAGQSPDGYWRALARDMLVDAHEAEQRAGEEASCATS
jgi:hypothetical protein